MVSVSTAICAVSLIVYYTKVIVSTSCDFLAINLVNNVVDILDIVTIRDDLVTSNFVL